MFAQLTANVRNRGALESLPLCAVPEGSDQVEIVSGHHRFQAAAAAGLPDVIILLDQSGLTRTDITAKQIAHNAIEGFDDPGVLRQLLDSLGNDVDALLETFIGAELIEQPKLEPIVFPDVEFEYKVLSFAFLPHQLDNFDQLMDQLQGRQDLVPAAPMEQYDAFVKAISKYARVKRIGRAANAVAYLTEVALRELATIEQLEALGQDGEGDDPAS